MAGAFLVALVVGEAAFLTSTFLASTFLATTVFFVVFLQQVCSQMQVSRRT